MFTHGRCYFVLSMTTYIVSTTALTLLGESCYHAHPFSCGVVLGAGGEENDDGEDNESEECFCQKNLFHYCLFVKANIRESFKREKWNPTKKP